MYIDIYIYIYILYVCILYVYILYVYVLYKYISKMRFFLTYKEGLEETEI